MSLFESMSVSFFPFFPSIRNFRGRSSRRAWRSATPAESSTASRTTSSRRRPPCNLLCGLYRVCQKKTTPSHFSSCVRNFRRISNRIILNESQVNFRSYVEKFFKINRLVSKILTVKVKIRIFELNRLNSRISTLSHFSSCVRNFQQISNRIILN